MRRIRRLGWRRPFMGWLSLTLLFGVCPVASAANNLDGRWLLTVTIPESPGSRNNRTFTINLNVKPRGDSLVGRLTVTDAEGQTVGGVWRQVAKRVSISYELPCSPDATTPCTTLVLIGKIKFENTELRKGKVIVMWDTENDRDPALFDTATGSFSGIRLP